MLKLFAYVYACRTIHVPFYMSKDIRFLRIHFWTLEYLTKVPHEQISFQRTSCIKISRQTAETDRGLRILLQKLNFHQTVTYMYTFVNVPICDKHFATIWHLIWHNFNKFQVLRYGHRRFGWPVAGGPYGLLSEQVSAMCPPRANYS